MSSAAKVRAAPPKKRNHYVDFFRGLAAISVILIHTAWWSGSAYVPEYARQLTLLFEVPLFFFLAGWTYGFSSNVKKYLKSLTRLQLQYMLFIVIFIILLFCMGSESITGKNILAWLLHYYIPADKLPIVLGSFWFLAVYFSVSLVGVALIKYLNVRQLILMLIPLVLLTLYFQLYPFGMTGGVFHVIKPDFIAFYLFFYLLGYVLKDVYIKKWQVIAGLVVGTSVLLFVLGKVLQVNIFNLQELKFPPTLIYLLWSMYGIYVVIALKHRFEGMANNFISYLGTIALYIFFAQGISSSLIYYYADYMMLPHWSLKLLLIFCINLAITLAITFALKFIFEKVEQGIGYAQPRIMKWYAVHHKK